MQKREEPVRCQEQSTREVSVVMDRFCSPIAVVAALVYAEQSPAWSAQWFRDPPFPVYCNYARWSHWGKHSWVLPGSEPPEQFSVNSVIISEQKGRKKRSVIRELGLQTASTDSKPYCSKQIKAPLTLSNRGLCFTSTHS